MHSNVIFISLIQDKFLQFEKLVQKKIELSQEQCTNQSKASESFSKLDKDLILDLSGQNSQSVKNMSLESSSEIIQNVFIQIKDIKVKECQAYKALKEKIEDYRFKMAASKAASSRFLMLANYNFELIHRLNNQVNMQSTSHDGIQ